MKKFELTKRAGALLILGVLAGCSGSPKPAETSLAAGGGGAVQAASPDSDAAIAKQLGDLLQRNGFEDVKYGVKNGVVTLAGEVDNQVERKEVEKEAASVPNVQQVVDQMQSFR